MALKIVLSLGLVTGASAYARASFMTSGQALLQKSFKDYVAGLKDGMPALGELQFLGSCCGDYSGGAVMIQEGINTNKIYGSTKDVAKQIFEESGCEAVSEEDMEKMGTAGCNYVSVFKNQLHAEHEYAANCVPAQVCKQDVVGMTKGLVATYGVVLQILQGNLGQLAYIGEGPTEDCMEGMNKINEGKLKDVLVEKPIKFGPIVIGKKEELEFGGMLRLGIEQSLSNCQDDHTLGYLFVHKNLYWSGDKSTVDLEAFTKYKEEKANERKEKAKAKEAAQIAAAQATNDMKTAEKTMDKAGAAPEPLKVMKKKESEAKPATQKVYLVEKPKAKDTEKAAPAPAIPAPAIKLPEIKTPTIETPTIETPTVDELAEAAAKASKDAADAAQASLAKAAADAKKALVAPPAMKLPEVETPKIETPTVDELAEAADAAKASLDKAAADAKKATPTIKTPTVDKLAKAAEKASKDVADAAKASADKAPAAPVQTAVDRRLSEVLV